MHQLTESLERALLLELVASFRSFNRIQFKDALRVPAFALSDDERTLGRWTKRDRTLTFSRRLVIDRPWTVVLEVLRHEMAHQYVSEVLRIDDEAAHGPAFRRTCERLGIDAAASGLPDASPDPDRDRVIGRVQKLLALGGSPNENEAQAAIAAAMRLMRHHNLDAAETGARPGYGFLQLGAPSLRTPGHERILAGLLADHFFVEAVWVPAYLPLQGRRGRVLEVSGTDANLQTADYVHAWFLRTAEALWRRYRATTGAAGGDRSRYLVGLALGFREQLDVAGRACEETGLVRVGDPKLSAWFSRRHPRVHSARAVTWTVTDAWHAGREDGRAMKLRRPMEAGGPTRQITTSK